LEAARAAYRKTLTSALDQVSDIWALEAIAVDMHRPPSRALTTNAAPLVFPALGCFTDEHREELRAVGASQNGPQAIVLNAQDAQTQARADFERIRAELTQE
jgi:hypothetical protein